MEALRPDLPGWLVHPARRPVLEDWSVMGWGEAGGLCRPGWKGVGFRGPWGGVLCAECSDMGSPRGTVMALGRAEKFLSWDEGKGMGGREGAPIRL